MAKIPNDDLFEGSKMTFGEHLEELRGHLFRAAAFLVAGVVVGLLVGDKVVLYIQTPLINAIEKFYLQQAVEDVAKKLPGQDTKSIETAINTHRVRPIPLLVDRAELERLAALTRDYPATEEQPAIEILPPGDDPPATSAPPGTPDAPPANDAGATNGADTNAGAVPDAAPPAAPRPSEQSPPEAARADDAPHYKPFEPVIPIKPQLIRMYTWEVVDVKAVSLGAHESFMIYLQAAIVVGIVLSSPFVFWEIWKFVEAGLYPHEKSYVYTFLPISLGLFLAGAALAFFAVFPPVLEYLLYFNKLIQVDPDPRISEWMGFVLMLPIGFGIAFQLPLVMLFIERIGIISVDTFLAQWRIAILVIFVLSAILTPADPMSMVLMAAPLSLLYFGGIGLCLWIPHGRKPFDEAYEP